MPKGSGNLVKFHRDGDRLLQLLIFNEEFLVSASHQLVLITDVTTSPSTKEIKESFQLLKLSFLILLALVWANYSPYSVFFLLLPLLFLSFLVAPLMSSPSSCFKRQVPTGTCLFGILLPLRSWNHFLCRILGFQL